MLLIRRALLFALPASRQVVLWLLPLSGFVIHRLHSSRTNSIWLAYRPKQSNRWHHSSGRFTHSWIKNILGDLLNFIMHYLRKPGVFLSLTKTADLSNNDYIIRATYKDSYWHYSLPNNLTIALLVALHILIYFFLNCIMVAFVNFLINERWWWWWWWWWWLSFWSSFFSQRPIR